MVLENVHVAAGPVPKATGNVQRDVLELQAYGERVMGVLERNFDLIQDEITRLEQMKKEEGNNG